MEITNQAIGQILAKLRRERGLRQEDLARAMQVECKAVGRWEQGKSGMSAVSLLQANYLLEGELLRALQGE